MEAIKFTLISSSTDRKFEAFCARVEVAISKKYGGCTASRGHGYWGEDSEGDSASYRCHKENAHILSVSIPCYLVKLTSKAEEDIRKIYQKAKDMSLCDIEWIHCESQLVENSHFKLK